MHLPTPLFFERIVFRFFPKRPGNKFKNVAIEKQKNQKQHAHVARPQNKQQAQNRHDRKLDPLPFVAAFKRSEILMFVFTSSKLSLLSTLLI